VSQISSLNTGLFCYVTSRERENLMKFIAITIMMMSTAAFAADNKSTVVYGEDNRKEVYQAEPLHQKLANSTAGMVAKYMFDRDGDDFNIKHRMTLEEGLNICPTERFAQQPLLANCSGFLVADDVLVTAGHCYKGMAHDACNTHVWVFGLELTARDTINLDKINKDNLYKCKQVVKATLNNEQDFAVIKLDRKVKGRTPLKFRKKGKVDSKSEMLVIGHPSMLPTKVATGGTILLNFDKYQFTTSLDTFQGNSGSAVFNADSGLLEGILVSGKTDYIPSVETDEESCQVVNTCDMNGNNCVGTDPGSLRVPGENVTRITTLVKYIEEAIKL
jgi:V8-like Glu-specific endopeptidase